MNDIDEFFEIAGTESDKEFNYQGSVENLSILTNKVARGLVKPNDMFYLETLKYILIAKKARDGKVGMDFTVFARRAIGNSLLVVRRGPEAWRSRFEPE